MNIPTFVSKPNPAIYESDNYLVLDFEVAHYYSGFPFSNNPDARLILAVWYYKGEYKKVWGGVHDMYELLEDIEKADFVVAHNAKFELAWLEKCGLDLTSILPYCTMVGDYVAGANLMRPRTLDAIAERYSLGAKDNFIGKCIKAGVCPSDLPESMLEKYCVQDVRLTLDVFLKQREELRQAGLLPVAYTRNLLTPVLVDIEDKGLYLDSDKVNAIYDEKVAELRRVEAELELFTGGINPRSSKQVAAFLYDELGFQEPHNRRGEPERTAAGGRKTDGETIAQLKATNKRQREFQRLKAEHANLTAALSKSLEFFKGVCDEHGGLFYGQIHQTRTVTHRLASSGRKLKFKQFKKEKGVQLQNLGRVFKPLFRARKEGWYVGEIDGAQLEFRVAAFLGQDARAYSDIRDGVDVHSFTSSIIGCSRQDAKAHTFKPLFGGQSGTKKEQEYYRAFREKYPGITQTQQDWINQALLHKEVRMPWNVIWKYPNARMTSSGYVQETPSICNYPVQSLATAEIIPVALIKLWHEMKARKMQSFLVNTIHDSAIAELHPDERELFGSIAVQSFTQYVYYYLKEVYDLEFNVPLGAGLKVGTHWSEGEEVKYESEPPFAFAA